MLDMVRYLVVWNPIIFLGLHFIFHWVSAARVAPPWAICAAGLRAVGPAVNMRIRPPALAWSCLRSRAAAPLRQPCWLCPQWVRA